jgi:DNA-binding XRE family transcriptional regulator
MSARGRTPRRGASSGRGGDLTSLHGTVYNPGMTPRKEKAVRWDGRRVRALRTYLGVTQEELAEELGTRQQTISEWETGKYRPRGTSSTILGVVAERSGFKYRAGGKKQR